MSSSQRLFLLEFLISEIKIDPATLPVPKIQDLMVHIRCPEFLFLDITLEEFSLPTVNPDVIPTDGVFKLNFGKTYLFSQTSQQLMSNMETTDVEMDLRILRKTVGSCKFPWKKEFIEMISIFEVIGVVKSVNYEGSLDMLSLYQQKIGQVEISIKMSCMGVGVETYFGLLNEGGAIFMNAKSDEQFKCERYNFEDEVVTPIACLYNPVLSCPISTPRLSWTELFGNKYTEPKQSIAPLIMEMDDMVCLAQPASQLKRQPAEILSHGSGFDIVSMVFRPPENKFFDFLNQMTAEAAAKEEETIVSVSMDKPKKPTTAFSDEVEIHTQDGDNAEEKSLGRMLTAEKIKNKLCNHKDCPAAIKFKQYGIGPLATGQGLGTLYNNVEPPVTYGLSHTYGSFEHYGPYGCFRRPKDPNQPYYPPADSYRIENEFEKSQIDSSCQKLREGRVNRVDSRKSKSCCKHRYPMPGTDGSRTLRLRGGGISTIDIHLDAVKNCENIIDQCDILLLEFKRWQVEQKGGIRLRGGGSADAASKTLSPKSAITECKSIMDQFDQILNAYKKALGPCGEATCPYAQNIVEDHCKDYCKQVKLPPMPKEESCEEIPCQKDFCPYTEKSFLAGCGSAKCAYAKYKTGLVDDDAALELMFLPAPVAESCGHPKCKYPLEPPLPPIHWDCPDPLPVETCKNPNCPYQPPELQAIKCPSPKPQPRGPCGSLNCPYALPSPCNNPSCPFKQTPCPYLEQKNKGNKNPICESKSKSDEEDNICDNPECPYRKKDSDDDVCDNPECPFRQSKNRSVLDYCGNPSCPSAPTYPTKRKNGKLCDSPAESEKSSSEISVCSNPNCPYAQKKNTNICDNPACPFKEKIPEKISVCSNPSCPYAKKKKNGICGNLNSPYAQESESEKSVCSNPECPFAKKKDSVCSNPDCPFAKKKDSICDNPCCPFARFKSKGSVRDNQFDDTSESSSVCDNPECPYAKKKSSISICSNPDCPIAKEKRAPESPESFCGNPSCPFFKRTNKGGRDGGGDDGGDGICGNPNCPYATNTRNRNSYCSDPLCPKTDSRGEKIQTRTEIVMEDGKAIVTAEVKADGGENVSNKKRKRKGRFVYSIGDKYPGVKIGHRECVTPRRNVPSYMGWLWNKYTPILQMKPRRGWRPGAIEKTIAKRIQAHRDAKGLGKLTVPKFPYRGAGRGLGRGVSSESLHIKPKPTLHIQKKEGTYFITMNPLKDPKTLAENEDPYMECTPMQFKITKPKKSDDDSKLCHCDDPPESSSDSELDIEFTPPAGIIHPERFVKKKNIATCDTQYDPKDFEVKKSKSKDDKKKAGKGKKGKAGKGKK